MKNPDLFVGPKSENESLQFKHHFTIQWSISIRFHFPYYLIPIRGTDITHFLSVNAEHFKKILVKICASANNNKVTWTSGRWKEEGNINWYVVLPQSSSLFLCDKSTFCSNESITYQQSLINSTVINDYQFVMRKLQRKYILSHWGQNSDTFFSTSLDTTCCSSLRPEPRSEAFHYPQSIISERQLIYMPFIVCLRILPV